MTSPPRRSRLALPALVAALAAAGASLAGAAPVAGAPEGPALTAAALAREQARRPGQVALALAHVEAHRTALGLSPADTLVAGGDFTNGEGQAVVQLSHRHAGHAVLGSRAVARVSPDGSTQVLASRLRTGLALPAAPHLTPERALEAALARVAPDRTLARPPRVEQVAFPAGAVGGLVMMRDPATGAPAVDRLRSVHARVGTPWVWAYRVFTGLERRPEGPRDLVTYVHGDTGAILRVDDLVQRVAVTPAVGTGTGLYCGQVALDASRMADGTYALYDTTRGAVPNPGLSAYTPDDSGWSATGLQAWYAENDVTGAPTGLLYLYQSNPTNRWGDGQPFTAWGQEGGKTGQTAAVDALHGLAATWDFYRQVLGRSGIDGKGTSTGAIVHLNGNFYTDNAWWSIGEHLGYFGAGSWPANPDGLSEVTDLDVVAHEATHGLTSPSFDQYWVNSAGFEEAGLSEATSDFFSHMVGLHARRTAGAPADRVPNDQGTWTIGAGVGHGTPIRWLDRPAKDGRSVEAWYDGVAYLDGHFSAGVLNRALYFLARGASADPASDAHSAYLPGGLAGVGNDIATRIWFKAVTERLGGDGTGDLTFDDARAAAVASAEDLYGAGSAPAQAAALAFAAVNVGDAPGAPPGVRVRFADWRDGDFIESSHASHWANREEFPKGETVPLRITVENAANPSVTWSIGGPSMFSGADYFVTAGGRIEPDGTWRAPNQMGWFALTATSNADPLQRAEGRVFLLNMDNDADGEQDALDMGAISFSWFLTNGLTYFHSVYQAPWVDDGDVGAFVDAMRSAWPAK